MLVPLRDYLSPKDLKPSPLPWIGTSPRCQSILTQTSPTLWNYDGSCQHVNIEHILDIFTTIDENSDSVWDACANFMQHTNRNACMRSRSMECRRLLMYTLKLWRERGDDYRVALALRHLSDTNRLMDLLKEG